LGVPSIEDKIAEKAMLDVYDKQIQQLEKSNARLKKVLEKKQERDAPSKVGGQGQARHIAHAEGWQAVCTAPDYCKVGKDVVAFSSFATLDQKQTASSNVKARGTAVYRKGDVIRNVQADAGQHIVSGTSLGRGYVKILDGHENVKVNGVPVARHDSRCLINCDASGVGGAPGKVVTEQKSDNGPSGPSAVSEMPSGERMSVKLDALKKARAAVALGMIDLNAIDELVNFQQTNEFLDELISAISGTDGSATGYAAQAVRGVLGFGKDFVMGVGELAYEGIKAIPKLAQLTQTQSGRLCAQLDAEILAETIKLGNVTTQTLTKTALNVGKAVIKPITDPWAKGQHVESVTRGVAEVVSLGLGWLKGSKASQAGKLAEATKSAEATNAAKPIEGNRVAAKSAPHGAKTGAHLDDGVHVKSNAHAPRSLSPVALAEREKITQLSNEAGNAEKSARIARTRGDEIAALKFDEIADARIKEAREILQPSVDSGDVRAIVDRLDVTAPKDGAHFWSGWADGASSRAGTMAQEVGGVSLETTPGGRVANGWSEIDKSVHPSVRDGFWPGISEKYAAGAEGTIKIVQSEAAWLKGGGEIWQNVELPQILSNGKVTEGVFLDLNGNIRKVLPFDELVPLNPNPSQRWLTH
jgi:uncharacterized Zn-binding protein involved in type VI secretion